MQKTLERVLVSRVRATVVHSEAVKPQKSKSWTVVMNMEFN